MSRVKSKTATAGIFFVGHYVSKNIHFVLINRTILFWFVHWCKLHLDINQCPAPSFPGLVSFLLTSGQTKEEFNCNYYPYSSMSIIDLCGLIE